MKHMGTYESSTVYLVALNNITRQQIIILDPTDLHEEEREWINSIIASPAVQTYDWLYKIAPTIKHEKGFNAFDFMLARGREVPAFTVAFADEAQCMAWLGNNDKFSTRSLNEARNFLKDAIATNKEVNIDIPEAPLPPIDESVVSSEPLPEAAPAQYEIPPEQKEALEAMKRQLDEQQRELDTVRQEQREAEIVVQRTPDPLPEPTTPPVSLATDEDLQELKDAVIGIQRTLRSMEKRYDETGKAIKRISKELNKHGVPTTEHLPAAKKA